MKDLHTHRAALTWIMFCDAMATDVDQLAFDEQTMIMSDELDTAYMCHVLGA